MKKAIYAGSFDPITKGHEWVIKTASTLFDQVLIVIAHNPAKSGMLTIQEKEALIKGVCSSLNNVSVHIITSQYVASFAKNNEVNYLVRGVRNAQDLEYESTIEKVNLEINPNLQTIYLSPPKELAAVSSSMVRSLVGFYGWQEQVAKFVHPLVVKELLKKSTIDFLQKEWNETCSSFFNHDTAAKWFTKIMDKHTEPHRYYHNTNHLVSLLKEFREYCNSNSRFTDPYGHAVIKFSIFFHDAVYNTHSKTNEEDSANLWDQFCDEMKMTPLVRNQVKENILASKDHTKATKHPLVDLFLDLDLSILGSDELTFADYENSIRLEYSWVPMEQYIPARNSIMRGFSNPYRLDWSKNKFSTTLEKNLQKYK